MNKKAIFFLVLLALFQIGAVHAKIMIVESEESGSTEASEGTSAAESSGEEGSDEESSDEESAAQTKPLTAGESSEESSEESSGSGCHQKKTKVCVVNDLNAKSADNSQSSSESTPAEASGLSDDARKVQVKQALDPINSWLKEFKVRTGGALNIKAMAKTTVAPLIKRLKRAQDETVEKMVEKNRDILMHVQETTEDHAMKLLRAEQKVQKKQDEMESKEEKLEEAQADVQQKAESAELAKDEAKKAESSGASASSSAKALSKALRR